MRLRVLDKFIEYFSYIHFFTILLYGDVSFTVVFLCVLCGVNLSVTENPLSFRDVSLSFLDSFNSLKVTTFNKAKKDYKAALKYSGFSLAFYDLICFLALAK